MTLFFTLTFQTAAKPEQLIGLPPMIHIFKPAHDGDWWSVWADNEGDGPMNGLFLSTAPTRYQAIYEAAQALLKELDRLNYAKHDDTFST